MLHEMLWSANFHLAQSCLAHPFVEALGNGTLEPDLFRGFIAAAHTRQHQKAL